ncbi:glycoside hydrolase family 9 protein [Nocardioides pacificus]
MPAPDLASRRRRLPSALVATLAGALALSLTAPGPDAATAGEPAADPAVAAVRVNQVGYLADDPKRVFVMTRADVPQASYDLVRPDGSVAATGAVGADTGRWSERWPQVRVLDLGAVTTPGRYRVVLGDGLSGESPWFTIGSGEDLYAPLVANAVRFFQAQRDGRQVIPSVMRRRPSHLHDRRARVHLPPTYRRGRLVGDLRATGRTADVSGGWFDAGDYLKFVETTSYADVLLLSAARDASSPHPALEREALFGARWLDRMWLDRSRQLLHQVGLGDGRPGLLGDHDRWRLPEVDDRLPAGPRAATRYLARRPAFVANAPGEQISPNLAGRTAAAFALSAQLLADTRPAQARTWLRKARAVLASARTRGVRRLVTTAPHSYYEEDEWRDDLELGATEIALAGQALGASRPVQRRDLKQAARWARAYLTGPHHGWFTLARDDQSALAHADLARAIVEARVRPRLAVTRADLVGDLRYQLRIAERRYAAPLGFGGDEDPGADFALGVAVTERLYRDLSGDASYAALGALQRDWVLGTNAWGTSLVVGAGTTYPRCPHHQVASLVGAAGGSELLGAVSNGPSAAGDFQGIGAPGDYAPACPASGGNPFAEYDGQGARYLDDVRAWSATEPALDYVAVSLLAFAQQR